MSEFAVAAVIRSVDFPGCGFVLAGLKIIIIGQPYRPIKGVLNLDKNWQSDYVFYIIMH